MQPEPKKGRPPSRRRKRSRSPPEENGGAGSPPPETCDLECAFDALSVIESGDPSVINLISHLGVDDSSSSTSSNCSTSSFDDDDGNVMHKKSQSDDDDINENYPVDPHKIAAISSAFSSRHLPPKRSKMHRIRTNFNKKMEPQQMAQFLLPLYASQAEEIYSDPHFLNIKQEDILQALTSAKLTCFTKCDNEESIPLSFESPLSSEEKELLSHIKKILSSPDFTNIQMPTVDSNDSGDDKNKKSKTYKNNSNSITEIGKTDKKTKNEKTKSEESKDDYKGCPNDDIDSFLVRKCCTNKNLADGEECPINKCHKKWKYVKDGLVKFILIPGQFDFNSSADDDMIEEINIPQIIFDCDSVNTRERFLYRNQLDRLCPGGCGNEKHCTRYSFDYEDYEESNADDDDDNVIDILDEHLILIDIKSAWNELKTLMFWLYWVSTQGFGDFDEFAIGFETTCYCCYCFHAKNLAKSERSKQCSDQSPKDSHAANARCTCRKSKSAGKGRNKPKTRFKSDSHGKESKCSFCASKEKEQESSDSMDSSMEDNLKCINLPVEDCCCNPSKTHAELSCEDENPTMFVCHKNEMYPPAYVDLSSGDGLTADEIKSKIPSSIIAFYTASCEKWRKGDQKFLVEASSSNYLCKQCYCDCSKPKFYSLLEIISRITELIDNLVRLDFPYFIHMMDTFYLSLFCRYNAILLTVFSNGCGFFFFKELTQIARIIRKCGTWLMQILGPKRLRLAYTLFFALPGQHFLNSIYWKWADVPALDHFLKLSVMLSHDIISQEWRNLLVDFLDILPYLYDAAVLSDIDDVFSISRFRQDFDEDIQLSMMYECYSLIQKKCLDKSLVWHLNFNKMDEDSNIDYESTIYDAAISRFLNNLTETILKPKKIEIKLLSKFCTNGWYDFEKLLAYSLIKAYAIGHFINNEYLNFWIKKVFCFCIDPDASLKCINKTKLSLQLFIDLMAYHKNVKKLNQSTLNQISMDGHLDKIKILIKAFHSKHFGSSPNKPDKVNLKMDRYIKINEETMKKLEKQFNCNFIWSEAGETSRNEYKNTIKITTAETFKKFNPVTLLIEFFNAIYNKDSIMKKRAPCPCDFHKSLIDEKSKKISKLTNNSLCIDDAEVSEYTVDIPENFNYDSSDDTMNSDDDDSLNDISNQSDYDSSDGEIENIKIPMLLSHTNFDSTEDKEKWSLFTAQLLSDHALNVSKGIMMNCNKKTIINEFIDRDMKSSQLKNGCLTRTCENTLKRIERSMKMDHDNLDLDTTVLFENMSIDQMSDDKSDVSEDLLSNMFPDAICNLDRTEKFKTALKDCFIATMKEIKQLYDVYDSKSVDELLKYDHSWDPTIEEVEEGIVKVVRKGITKQEFELDLHIVCFHIITRSMLQELTPSDKEKRIAFKEKKSDKLSRKRKSAGYFVGDYWISLKCQFKKWRIAAIKIYNNLITLHKNINGSIPSFKDIGCDFFHYYGFIKGCLLVTRLNTIQDSATAATYLMKDKNVSMFHICEGTWLFAVNEIERLEKKMKKSSEMSESISKKKFFEETREAELLGGRGLSKMINKCSKKTVVENSEPANGNSQTKKDTTIVVRHVANKSGFQQSVEACIKHFDSSDTDLNEVSTITFIHTSNKTTKLTCEQEIKEVNPKTPSKVVKSDVKVSNNSTKSSDIVPLKEIDSDQNKNVNNNTEQPKNKSTNSAQKDTVKEKCTINHESHGKCYTEGKCPLHPDSSRSNHLQTGEHPCNCCYCTVFGQVPPMTSPVSRNFNETRERMRSKLNKKKMSEKGKVEDKTPQITASETNVKESDKIDRTQVATQSGNALTNSNSNSKINQNPNKTPVPANPKKDNSVSSDEPVKTPTPSEEKEIINKIIARHTKGVNDLVKQGKLKKPSSLPINSSEAKVIIMPKNRVSIAESKSAGGNSGKDNQEAKKSNVKPQVKATLPTALKTNTVSISPVTKSENSNETSQRCHSCSRMESKKKQTDTAAAQNSDSKTNDSDKNENKAALTKLTAATKVPVDSKSSSKAAQNKVGCTSNTHSTKSSDGSFCSSPTCSGWGLSGCEDDRDLNMLVKFIEEPHRAADKEKKQAKKARQKNKKLKMELLKERDELHEDLISMVGETSRLREEVVRLEQGLASACRRLPPTNKYNNVKHSNATDAEIDLEEHECALLLKRAAQEASARATEAATLAEQAHSRLRHVESALNLLSSSVNRACVKQQKLGQSEETTKNAKQSMQQNAQSVYNVDQVLYKNSDFYNNSGSNQGMVTIKRVLLPNSEEHGVTITPKGSDHLIYTSQDHSMGLHNSEKESSENKQAAPKKQNLSWESTIAQINSLANAKKKPKAPPPSEKKKPDNNKKTEVTKSKVKEEAPQKNTTSSTAANQTLGNKKNKKNPEVETFNEISAEPTLSKKNLKKMRKAALKAEQDSLAENENNESKFEIESVMKQFDDNSNSKQKKSKNSNKTNDIDNTKTSQKNETKKTNQKQEIEKNQVKPANKSNKTNPTKGDTNEASNTKGNKGSNENQSQNQPNSQKGKKNQQLPASKASTQKASNQSPQANNQTTSLQIVNSLTSAVDKIKLNDDTTIELASSKKDSMADSDDLSSGNKNAPVSSSIMEQLRSGVQFADLRLPPGITLTRVDPAKQHNVSKSNIPLMTSSTPSAYRPTPPAPPPPAVIMVDTTKLHADRESKSQPTPQNAGDPKKTTKSKKSKKKNKKQPHHVQQATGATSVHTSSINISNEQPKMVTLRNPMFHSTLAPPGMTNMQAPGKRMNDIRLPDPIPMPPNASCQATITPTSNGMYTIRNPLMSMVHQQSMMGMNSIETPPNPILLMANQHLNQPAPHTYCSKICDDPSPRNMCDSNNDLKESINNITNRFTNCSLEKCKEDNSADSQNKLNKKTVFPKFNGNKFNPVPQAPDESRHVIKDDKTKIVENIEKQTIVTPSPIGAPRYQEHRKSSIDKQTSHCENPIQKPIGTPFSQFNVPETSKATVEASVNLNHPDMPEPQKLYTPFGPTDPDKTFGSILYQPFSREQNNDSIWSSQTDSQCQPVLEDKTRLPPYVHRLGASRVIVDSDNSTFPQLDGNEQSKNWKNCQTKVDSHCDPKTLQGSQTPHTSHPYIYQHFLYEANKESLNNSKSWNNGMYPQDHEFYNKYYNQFSTGLSPLHHSKLSHSSSSSCVPSDSSSVYDSISNSSSNSPADSSNVINNTNNVPDYNYMPPHQISILKTGGVYNPADSFVDPNHPVNHEGFNNFSGLKNVTVNENSDKCIPNVWKDGFTQFKDVYGVGAPMPNSIDNSLKFEGCGNSISQNAVGSQRLSNGLIQNENFFAESSSVFAPDQSITNLNELDSSERDIESFKRFDYYFEPPKNKPKISLNVQDIAFQRPSPTKPMYRNN